MPATQEERQRIVSLHIRDDADPADAYAVLYQKVKGVEERVRSLMDPIIEAQQGPGDKQAFCQTAANFYSSEFRGFDRDELLFYLATESSKGLYAYVRRQHGLIGQ